MTYALLQVGISVREDDIMGFIIDLIYFVREIVKLAVMVIISPFGLAAIYLISGE